MKMIRIIPILLSLVSLVLVSCESEVDNIGPIDVSSKLVVVSYISPQDTLLTARLQKSQPAIGKRMTEEQMKIKDASVIMSDGSTSVALIYNPVTNLYEADAKTWTIRPGQTYSLKVRTAGGVTAEASTTVPAIDRIAITDVAVTNKMEDTEWAGPVNKYSVYLEWRDDPQVKNYYHVLAYKQFSAIDYNGNQQIHREGITAEYGKEDSFTDERTTNGILVSEEMKFYQYDDNMHKPTHIYGVLVVSDIHYYLYHQSVSKQSEFDGNPFAEPSIMYTNIAGGIGVFGAYNQLVEAVELD